MRFYWGVLILHLDNKFKYINLKKWRQEKFFSKYLLMLIIIYFYEYFSERKTVKKISNTFTHSLNNVFAFSFFLLGFI